MPLLLLSVAQFLLALDYSIVYVALPGLAADLGLDLAAAQWVVSAYAVPFAGFLLVGGRLADRVGAGRLFVAAAAGFGVASVAGGLASSGGVLLGARFAQGVAAALLQPAILGLLGTMFPARSRALSVWGAVGASGLAAGVVLGGVLTRASWRWTFLVNVPVTVLCAVGGLLWLRSRAVRGAGVPLTGSLLGTGAALGAVLGLTLGGTAGWTAPATLGTLLAAAGFAAGFVAHERRAATPLVEPALRHIRSLRVGVAATALYMASVGSEFYVVTLLLQSERGYPPLRAGLAFLPLAALVAVGSAVTGRAVRRFGSPAVLSAGFTLAALGLGWLALAAGAPYATGLLPGLLLSGFAHGMIYTAMFVLGGRDVPPAHQSSAGAVLTTSQYLSGAVTIAALTLVLGGAGGFGALFAATAAAALAGAALAARATTRPSRPDPAPSPAAAAAGTGAPPAT
ncbi:MFS transporter [Dactylosporangium sp. NPDC050688]|uniref:MFS transporter n=1 Tax=Dactylosporangium sp. NPDC050688 TaxID=3157217 RepID=UPI0033F7C01E